MAAAVAAPMQKLCPEIAPLGIPADSSAVFTSLTKSLLDSGFPSNLKKGPSPSFLSTRYLSNAFTGYNSCPVLPSVTFAPFLSLSVFDSLTWSVTI